MTTERLVAHSMNRLWVESGPVGGALVLQAFVELGTSACWPKAPGIGRQKQRRARREQNMLSLKTCRMSDWKSFREEMGAAFHTQMLAIPYADHCQKHQVNQVLMFRMLSSAACAHGVLSEHLLAFVSCAVLACLYAGKSPS